MLQPNSPDENAAYRTHIVGREAIAHELSILNGSHLTSVVPSSGTVPPPRPRIIPQAPVSVADRYELLGEIARGGMGVLLRARDHVIGREVVIKVLREEFLGCAASELRFLREVRVNGQLQHPGIVPVYDVGRFADGRPFLTMRYVYGRTLDALLADRATPSEDRVRFLQIVSQVCQTIAYAHAKGVVHRDVKPSNIIVAGFGQVRVLDWGLARVLSSTDSPRDPEPADGVASFAGDLSAGQHTLVGAAVGTPAFIPPEQARGESTLMDERCDVFGLGGLLCMTLTGTPPYLGTTAAAVWDLAKRGDLSAGFSRLDRADAQPMLIALAKACLAPDPADRPRTAGEVARQLDALVSQPSVARRGLWQRLFR